jgi:hypothetical protein
MTGQELTAGHFAFTGRDEPVDDEKPASRRNGQLTGLGAQGSTYVTRV